jgi:uncharacterized protein (DUF2141 family)
MGRQVLQILSVYGLFLLLYGCAQVVPLTGGKRDTTPPKLVETDPKDRSVNLNTGRIVMLFDEYVQLKDAGNQFVISPRLKNKPEVTAEGKKVIVTFDPADLLPNTTYRINFGSAVADMNESNSLNGLSFVFSTGSHIDTLHLSGKVTESSNNLPAKDVLVGLYRGETANDSLPYKTAADYAVKTSADGSYSFSNLPPARFSVYAIGDNNRNGIYDGESEKMAFMGEVLSLTSDSAIDLRTFTEEPRKTFVKKLVNPYYGFGQVILNKPVSAVLTPLAERNRRDVYQEHKESENDTLTYYYKDITDSLILLMRETGINRTDTLKVTLPAPPKKKLRSIALNNPENKLNPGEQLRFSFPVWMDTTKVSPGRIKLVRRSDTTSAPVVIRGSWLNIHTYVPDIKLLEIETYTLKTDTGAFYDTQGTTNDSLKTTFRVLGKAELGKLSLKIRFNRKQKYVLQLLNAQNNVAGERTVSFTLSSSNAETIEFTGLQPSTYYLRVIFDDNGNGKWDTGNLLRRMQPEKVVMVSKQFKIVADWEVEEEIMIKDQESR